MFRTITAAAIALVTAVSLSFAGGKQASKQDIVDIAAGAGTINIPDTVGYQRRSGSERLAGTLALPSETTPNSKSDAPRAHARPSAESDAPDA